MKNQTPDTPHDFALLRVACEESIEADSNLMTHSPFVGQRAADKREAFAALAQPATILALLNQYNAVRAIHTDDPMRDIQSISMARPESTAAWAAIHAAVIGEPDDATLRNNREPDGTLQVEFRIEGYNVDFPAFMESILPLIREPAIAEGREEANRVYSNAFDEAHEAADEVLNNIRKQLENEEKP